MQSARRAQKRLSILAAARDLFLTHGYTGVSMDQVGALAQVSKVTVYAHFADKQSLFTAVMQDAIDEADAASRSLVDGLGTSTDLANDLRTFARDHLKTVTQPHLIQLRRMVIAEANRFPELARSWHRAAPERGHATLARQLHQLADRGLLRVPDPLLAAQNLNYLILSALLNEAMFTGRRTPFPRRTIYRHADEAVRIFLAGYAPAS